jgi:large subunit ribosomal protein L5
MKERYEKEIRAELIKRFEYSSAMQAPKLEKIVVNMGVGDAKQDSKVLEAAQEQLATITGQHPNIRRSKKSIAQFKLREGMAVGLAVTLRGEKMYEFLDRLLSVAIPRIRDFRGLNPKSFDGRGNYAIGVREQIIFPEIDYDAVDQVRGLDIVMATSAQTDEEAFALLQLFGMPFAKPAEPKPAPVAAAPAAEAAPAESDEAPAEEAPADEPTEEPEVEAAPEAEESAEQEETSDEGEGEAEEAPAEDA